MDKRPLRLPALAGFAAASACVAVPPSAPPDARAPAFPVFRFFEGRTHGQASLKVAFRKTEPVRVESFGQVKGDVLLLRQTIHEGDKPARDRSWRIREVTPGRYAATLTDAGGPVTVQAIDGRLHLAFRMKGGVDAEQWLTLARDGRSAHNVLTARKFGIVVAALEETISKED